MPPGLVLHPPQLLIPNPGLHPGYPLQSTSQAPYWGQSGTLDKAGLPSGVFLAGAGVEAGGGEVEEG